MASRQHTAGSRSSADERARGQVLAFNPQRGDFDALSAVRAGPDVWELQEGPGGHGFGAGDLVRVELADGELIVRERVYRTRLL